MAVLRLFAAAREAAGTATDEVPGETIDEVLVAARARYGSGFADVLAASRVWCNGEPAAGADPVGPADEVAVLPPVSGGSEGPEPPPRVRPRPVRGPGAPDDPAPAPRRRSRPDDPRPAARARPAPAPRRDRPAPGAPPPRDRSAPGGPAARRDRPAPAPPRRRPPRPTAGADRPVAPWDVATAARPAADGPAAASPPPAPAPAATAPAPTGPAPTRGRPAPAPRGRRRAPVDSAPPPAPAPAAPGPVVPAPGPVAGPPSGALTRTAAVAGTPMAGADPAGGSAQAGRLTRMRSVAVPVTGQVRVWGKERQVSGARTRTTGFGRRYAVVYDTEGWKVTLGMAWFVVALAATIEGWAPLSLLYGVAAGWAALEVARRRREVGGGPHPWVAALGGGAVAAAGAGGSALLGLAVLGLVLAAGAVAALGPGGRSGAVPTAAATVLCALPVGLAAACLVLTRDLEIGAAITLLVFVSCYEAGDFLIGSGASNSIEGPLVGIVTVVVAAVVVAVLHVPPFDGQPVFTFAALAAVACPVGQLVASGLLPASDARAPALRRLDSLLVLAPLWCWAVGLLIDSQA
ncbi:MAG TPA: MoaD/ThiS family protein [Acidimicrobiales bacterium]|nr:MoaD/ThiS family protein [Acidimicrobiales bacterium]